MKENYQWMLDKTIQKECGNGRRPRLLLHACCAPCSSYVLEYLASLFQITLLFYNPNIFPPEEYRFRKEELKRLISEMGLSPSVMVLEGRYDPEEFFQIARGRESLPEGGERCYACYRLRLSECGRIAAAEGFDFFTTTLSISPYKNAQWLNEIGDAVAAEVGVPYLHSDFKKKNGYKRSCELSAEYGLYRQDYCGCVYSKQAKEQRES